MVSLYTGTSLGLDFRVSSLRRFFSRGLLALGYLSALALNPKQHIRRMSQSSLGEGGLRAEAGIEGEKEERE